MKTENLIGATLDYWAAIANGHDVSKWGMVPMDAWYSSRWEIAGPIIERERLQISYMPSDAEHDVPRWYANPYPPLDATGGNSRVGRTALEAAMRCYVAIKFGDEVPDAPLS